MLKFNGKVMKFGNVWGAAGSVTPPEPLDEVQIGTQIWKTKNLAIDDGGTGIVHFDNVSANGVNFGTQYYYTRAAALRIADTIDGWHVPSKEEFSILSHYLGENAGTKLKSTYGWEVNGTDEYGFTGLPVGASWGNAIYYAGQRARYITSTTNCMVELQGIANGTSNNMLYFWNSYTYNDNMLVRLVKDA